MMLDHKSSLVRVLTSAEASQIAKRRRTVGRRSVRAELREIQALLLKDIRNPETPPHIRAQCTRAYNDCDERLRIHNGKPLPGQLRPDLEQRKQARRSKPLLLPEPIAEAAPQEKPA